MALLEVTEDVEVMSADEKRALIFANSLEIDPLAPQNLNDVSPVAQDEISRSLMKESEKVIKDQVIIFLQNRDSLQLSFIFSILFAQ